MSLSCAFLAIRAAWQAGELVAVRANDGARACRDGSYEMLSAREASALLDRTDRRFLADLRRFFERARLAPLPLAGLDDHALRALLSALVRTGHIAVLREGEGSSRETGGSTLAQRRIVREIEAASRGKLAHAGRQYKVVADQDLGRLPGREGYAVVGHDDAATILASIAADNSANSRLAGALGKARDKLTRDWRPPLEPDGLILLRKLPIVSAYKPDLGPALTPSQLKQLSKKTEWIEIEVVDDKEKPYTGAYRLELPNGTAIEGNFSDGFYGNYDIEPGSCKLYLFEKGSSTSAPSSASGKPPAPPHEAEPQALAQASRLAEEEETVEVSAKVVDELGNPVAGVALLFQRGGDSVPATTDANGIGKGEVSGADGVQVLFADAAALAEQMKPIWTACRGAGRKDWVQADDATTVVTFLADKVVKVLADSATTATTRPRADIETFEGAATTPEKPPTLSVQPLVIVVRMLGEHFDVDKCFLLPKALAGIQELVRLHREYELTDLLIVGHTDTSGAEDYNLDLSLERTSAMRAYLVNDADHWLTWYGSDKSWSKRWGSTEDNYMIGALVADTSYPPTVLGFQQWHNASALRSDGFEELDDDGVMGSHTRRQLILDYMHREDTTVPDDTVIEVHGCGEYFPLDATGESLDTAALDGQYEQEDRRVEVFLFPKELGMLPAVPGTKAAKDARQYAEWRKRSLEIDSLTLRDSKLRLRLHDGDRNPLPAGTPYRYTMGGSPTPEMMASLDGWIEIELPQNVCPESILLEWGEKDDAGEYRYAEKLYVDCDVGDEDAQARTKLNNLGYWVAEDSIEPAVVAFQTDYGLSERGLFGGHLPPQTRLKLWKIYETDCDASTPSSGTT